jgi:hypothetical protein
MEGEFPGYIVERLREVLASLGKTPLIVRSSGLLEDNFGLSFAGKYTSYFCPNQATLAQNLQCLLNAIRRVYASSLNPDALLYRRNNQLLDYDERMAIILQRATGLRHGRYFFPAIAGVAFSQNPFRWSPDIQARDGFLRIVCGLGTRAVERVSQDYPRLIALSHPQLRPETTPEAIRRYSQTLIDAFDLLDNRTTTLPVREALPPDYAALPLIASLDCGDHLEPIPPGHVLEPEEAYVLTFDGLAADEQFIELMRAALRRLEKVYRRPVDVEFALEVANGANPGVDVPNLDGQEAAEDSEDPTRAQMSYRLHILECRPLRVVEPLQVSALPDHVDAADLLFSTHSLLPSGQAGDIRYAIFIDPQRYRELENENDRRAVVAAIGRLNERLPARRFVLIGPGRWGSANSQFSVPVRYSDICGSAALMELAAAGEGHIPELAYGTDFYQDLVEADIYDIPIRLDSEGGTFNWSFLRESPNHLALFSPEDFGLSQIVRVIDITAVTGKQLRITIDDNTDRAVGYLA